MNLTKEKLKEILDDLSSERPIFHSEADFQFALAWRIKETFEDEIEVRLEYPIKESEEKTNHIDIVLYDKNKKLIPIELKYKTKELEYTNEDGEKYHLKAQSAQNLGSLNYLLDICRIENILKDKNNNCEVGYTIMITNDDRYITEPKLDSESHKVSLYDRDKKGNNVKNIKIGIDYSYTDHGKKLIEKKDFLKPNGYLCAWEKFSEIKDKENTVFYYVLHEIRN